MTDLERAKIALPGDWAKLLKAVNNGLITMEEAEAAILRRYRS